ncbi:MAG TPA: hypothetical protein VGR35_06200 [Tepidisphaeraceae bacterium]|nr:hypothetical protein [Tepidisphaeraceae bacterium]
MSLAILEVILPTWHALRLRFDYRHPNDLSECVLEGISFLEAVLGIARQPKQLLLKDGARRGLTSGSMSCPVLREWIMRELPAGSPR